MLKFQKTAEVKIKVTVEEGTTTAAEEKEATVNLAERRESLTLKRKTILSFQEEEDAAPMTANPREPEAKEEDGHNHLLIFV